MAERENGHQGEDGGSIVVADTVMSPDDVFSRPDVQRPSRPGPGFEVTTVPEPVDSRASSPTDEVLFRNAVAPESIPQSHVPSVLNARTLDVDREEATIDPKNVRTSTCPLSFCHSAC